MKTFLPMKWVIFSALIIQIATLPVFAKDDSAVAKDTKSLKQTTSEEKREGHRSERLIGIDLGIAQPFPALVGGIIGLNIKDDARFSFGFGTVSGWKAYQIDTKFFLLYTPLAPYFGVGLNYLNGPTKELLFWELQSTKVLMPFAEVGFDYTAPIDGPGVHINLNLGLGLASGSLIILPGIALGWYFDLK